MGREREQVRLRAYLEDALGGRGALVLVGGEAGIGKTTLVAALEHDARVRGALVLTGGCYDLTTTPPYGPWVEMLDSIPNTPGLPEAPSGLAPDEGQSGISSQADIFQHVVTDLNTIAESRPLVLVLEDLHWADDASLDLLRFVARNVRDRRILLIATYRDDEVSRGHPLFHLLPLLVREAQAARIDLRRLDRDAIEANVTGRYDLTAADRQRLVAYLERQSDGNPLYLAELLRALEEEHLLRTDGGTWSVLDLPDAIVPPLLRQVIDRRLARLRPATNDALAVAAIIGHQVPIDLWTTLSGLTDEQFADIVDEAVEAHVLDEVPTIEGLRFSHALVREAIYGTLGLPRRRAWHRRVAEALIALPNTSSDEVAYHFQQAGDARAVEWFVKAGIRARRADAWITAADRFATAASLLESNDGRITERGWLLFLAGYLMRFSVGARAIEMLDRAEQLAGSAGDPALLAYVLYARGAMRNMRADVRRGMRDLEAGVSAIDALLPGTQLWSTEEQAMSVIQRLLVVDESQTAKGGRRSEHHASFTPHPSPRINMQRGVLITWYAHIGRYKETIALGEAYIAELSRAFGQDYVRKPQCYSGLHGLGHAYAAFGRVQDARNAFALSRAGADHFNDHAVVEMNYWSEQLMVLIPYLTDQPAERVRLSSDAARAWERCVGVTITVVGDGAPSEVQFDLLEGHWNKAWQLATDHLTAPWANLVQEAVVVLGILAHRRGQPDLARQQITQLLPAGPATEPGDRIYAQAIAAITLAAELALDAGDLALARRWVETHARWLEWSGAELWRADTQLLWARWHERSGDIAAARQYAESGLSLASDPRQPLRIIAAHRLLGQLATREGQFDSAARHLTESLALAAACGAPFERALTLLALAELHVSTGHIADARTLLDEMREICTPLGARPTLDRADHLLPAASAGRSAPERPDGLTAREIEVLRLVAEGLTDVEVAERLYISRRTVGTHLTSIYTKINVTTRTAAARYAVDHGLT